MNQHAAGHGFRQASTVRQFCDDHQIGRTKFYELIKTGMGPRLMKVGKLTLVSAEAAADWRQRMEQATAEAHREAA